MRQYTRDEDIAQIMPSSSKVPLPLATKITKEIKLIQTNHNFQIIQNACT
jgi:hypothetical protein